MMSSKDSGGKKRVHWAFNLEQIMYFFPDFERQKSESKQKVRKKTKRVRWAFNLEQIVYFFPDFERQKPDREHKPESKHMMTTKLKIKARKRDFLNWMQEKAERFMKKLIPRHYGEVNFEDLTTDFKEH